MDMNTLLEPLHVILLQVGAFLPRLAVAVVAVLVGWLLAKAARYALVKACRTSSGARVVATSCHGRLPASTLRAITTRMISLVPSWIWCTRRSRTSFSTPYSLR